jgi:hypothetical protein
MAQARSTTPGLALLAPAVDHQAWPGLFGALGGVGRDPAAHDPLDVYKTYRFVAGANILTAAGGGSTLCAAVVIELSAAANDDGGG